MQTREMTKCICDNCHIEFEKATSEWKRNLEKGRKNFCSRSCCGKALIDNNIPKETRTYNHLAIHQRKKDEYTGLREFLIRVKKRNYEIDIDLQYLLEVWINQSGTCPYTGITLSLVNYKKNSNSKIHTASLDRIDSSKGYVKGNIQFVSMAINYMKNTMTHKETVELCKLIAEKWGNSSVG